MNRLWLKLSTCLVVVTLLSGCDSDGGARLTGTAIESQQLPVVTGFTPNPARAGQRVIIHGDNFGADRSTVSVMFGGVHGGVIFVSENRIDADLPASLSVGAHFVRVTVAGRSSIALQLLIEPGPGSGNDDSAPLPIVSSIAPNPARPGQRIVIAGQNFGTDRSAVSVTVDGEPANVVSVTDTRIDADVPSSLDTGTATLAVTVDGRSASSNLMIDVAAGGDGSGGDGSGAGGGGDGAGGNGDDGSGGNDGDGSGGGGSGDQSPDVSGTYDVDAGVASNSCPADFSAAAAALAANDAVVTQDGSSVTTDMGGGLRFTDEQVTAEGDFDASNGSDRLQQDFSQGAFTGTLTRDLGLCSVTFSLQGAKR